MLNFVSYCSAVIQEPYFNENYSRVIRPTIHPEYTQYIQQYVHMTK